MSKENSSFLTRHKLSNRLVAQIENLCKKLPYYYFDDCAYGNHDHPLRTVMNPYFSSTLLSVDGNISPYFREFPWNSIGQEIGMPNNPMIRSHMTLQYPRPEAFGVPHNSHVDDDRPHIVGLYYPNDADGDTFFFDGDQNVIHRESPERGKMVTFDGKQYHSSSSPTTGVRFTLNINYRP